MTIGPFAFGGYRSFAPAHHQLSEVSQVNLFAGPNNSGKSNILRFVANHYPHIIKRFSSPGNLVSTKNHFDDLDRYQGPGDGSFYFALGRKRIHDSDLDSNSERKLTQRVWYLARQVLDGLTDESEIAWFNFRATSFGAELKPEYPNSLVSVLRDNEWSTLWHGLTGKRQGGLEQHWIPQTLKSLCPTPSTPSCITVEAVRQIGASGSQIKGFSGSGIIERLATLQNPSYNQQEKRKSFRNISTFVQEVLGDASAEIEIPHKRDMIVVHQQGRTLPLQSLGTGVHEVIILAAAATIVENHVVCIEEPELHLHPVLQRKLLRYLAEKTTNQYFLTTHSASLLDTNIASIYHVSHDGKTSEIQLAQADSERHEVCQSLGYHASDLLQANCIVWVEGPSDRYYVRSWLGRRAPELIEGVHYSIMFYGGRLLSHLSAKDPEIDDFISLRKLNRQIVLLIDSDRRSKGDRINATKRRVKDEIQSSGGVVWITEGREIENYVTAEHLKKGILAVQTKARDICRVHKFHSALRYKDARGNIHDGVDVDKVKLAKKVADLNPGLDRLDLDEWISKIANYIRSANPDTSQAG